MKIAIFGNIYRTVIISHIHLIFNFFDDKDVIILVDKELHDFLSTYGEFNMEHTLMIRDDNFEADLVLSIGGDGTFLNTAARIGRKRIPILGINTGHLGFLADIPDEEILQALEAIVSNRYTVEKRSMIHVEILDGTELQYPYALNEVSILKQDSSSMININTSINNEMVHTYRADGLIISTPTGSTAYSLSVGGPILVPQAKNFILSPVASHSLNVRPLIIPDSWTIDLEVLSRSRSFLLALDGRSIVLEQKTKLRLTKANFSIKIVKQLNQNFFDTLKNKLFWGVDMRD